MSLEDEFADIVKKARQGRGLAVEDLSRLSGLPRSRLAELERGLDQPTVDELHSLAGSLALRPGPLADIALHGWQPHRQRSVEGVEAVYGDIGGYAVTGYVVYDAGTREAAIVDTGYNPESMVELIERRGLTLKAVCLTHGHLDHAGGLDRVLACWPVPVYIGEDDIDLLQWRPRRLTALRASDDGRRIAVGSRELVCLVTPGHTPGGLCYRVRFDSQEVCFVGDTLFAGSVGRANPFSLYPRHLESVRGRVLTQRHDTLLLPGHGPGTTVAEERAHNPFATGEERCASENRGDDDA